MTENDRDSDMSHVSISSLITIANLKKVDMSYFPFDTQVCYLKFGSWSYWKSLLNLMHTYPTNELIGDVSN